VARHTTASEESLDHVARSRDSKDKSTQHFPMSLRLPVCDTCLPGTMLKSTCHQMCPGISVGSNWVAALLIHFAFILKLDTHRARSFICGRGAAEAAKMRGVQAGLLSCDSSHSSADAAQHVQRFPHLALGEGCQWGCHIRGCRGSCSRAPGTLFLLHVLLSLLVLWPCVWGFSASFSSLLVQLTVFM
jgi:hypothetical protein